MSASMKAQPGTRLQTKDLINIGIFTAIYFVVFFATGMIGYIPVLMLAVPFLCPLVAGIPFMLFLTRVKKFGMVSIMGIILTLLMLVTGHPWPVLLFGIPLAVIGDLVMGIGGYRRWSMMFAGYILFSEWICGLMFPLFFMKDSYFASMREGYGDTYTDALDAITPPWLFFGMIAITALGAVAGAYLGKGALKKHFRKAGVA